MPPKHRRPAGPGMQITPRDIEGGVITLRPYQDEDLTATVGSLRRAGLSVPDDWESSWPLREMISMQARQTGKTWGISAEASIVCCTIPRARCITLSASLRQGAMNVQKDAEVWRDMNRLIRRQFGQDSARPDKDKLLITTPADDDKGRLLDLDAIADLLESGKLISKFRWSNAADNYASHEIWAANADTARGATAQRVFLDEAFTVQDYREVDRAIRHCISRVKGARYKKKGTPPISSSHESWEALYEDDKVNYIPNARGNWRWTNAPGGRGVPILRVSGWDAELAGVVSFDDITNQPTTVAEKLANSSDREGDAREIDLKFGSGGDTLIPYSSLTDARAHAMGGGMAFDLGVISGLNELGDDDLRAALRSHVPAEWTKHCRPGDAISFGHDQSTSDTEGRSNPASFTVAQEDGRLVHTRLIVSWLSRFPRVNEELMRMILGDAMRAGLNLRGMAVDASNEQFHAERLRTIFGHLCTVELFKNGEKAPSGNMLMKEHLAKQYAQLFVDRLISLPREGGHSTEWVLTDHSLAINTPRGPDWRTSKGRHFDTGCSGMLAVQMLKGAPMPLEITPVSAGSLRGVSDVWDDEHDDPTFLPPVPSAADPIF